MICTLEYGEVLLLDDGERIVKAYPMPGAPPSWITVTAHYVYAGRIGDGALPDSTLVRIDRSTMEATVLVFQVAESYERHWPPGWRLVEWDAPLWEKYEQTVATEHVLGNAVEMASWIGPVFVDTAGAEELVAMSATLSTEPTEPPSAADAEAALVGFLTAMRDGHYAEAVDRYAGTYAVLEEWNPTIDPADHRSLLDSACQSQLACDVFVRSVTLVSSTGHLFNFVVEFEDADGELIGLANQGVPAVFTEFGYGVVFGRYAGYRVLDLPPYLG